MSTPIPRICWGYTIVTGINDTIVVHSTSGDFTDATCVTPPGSYATPELLCNAVALAMQNQIIANDLGGATHATVGLSCAANGRVTITFGAITHSVTIKWTTVNALGLLLGSVAAVQGVDQTVLIGTPTSFYYQVQNYWYPGLPVRTDPRARSTYPRAVVETTGNSVVAVDFVSSPIVRRTISFENLPAYKTLISQEVNPYPNESLERLFVPGTGGYARFYWYDDATVIGSAGTVPNGIYALREKTAQQFKADRMYDTLELYKTTLEMTTTT